MSFLNYGGNTSNILQLSLNGYFASSVNINSTGVGIGTTNPSLPLNVAGDMTFATRLGQIRIQGATNSSYLMNIGLDTTNGAPFGYIQPEWTGNSFRNLALNPNGSNVGIGLTGPSYQLDLSTDGARKLTSTTWLTGSDQRIKTDIQSANLQTCYDTVKSIDLKYFKWNFPESSNVTVDDQHSLGFIAQEVQKVFPNAVSESNSYGYTDFLSLNTDQILKAMYGALKQTMADKERLEQSLISATANISSLEQSLETSRVVTESLSARLAAAGF